MDCEYTSFTFPIADLPLHVFRFDQGQMEMHRHRFMELVVVLGGWGVHVTENQDLPIRSGDVFVVERSAAHAYRAVEDLRIANLLFDEDYLSAAFPPLAADPGYLSLTRSEPRLRKDGGSTNRLRLSPERLERTIALIGRIEAELDGRKPLFRVFVTALFAEALIQFARWFAASDADDIPVLLGTARAIARIEKGYASELDLGELAATAAMSRATLLRHFRRATGQTPFRYLQELRIAKARRLLEEPSTRIGEAARAVGIDDPNYFTRLFRNLVGMSPSEYRRSVVRTAD